MVLGGPGRLQEERGRRLGSNTPLEKWGSVGSGNPHLRWGGGAAYKSPSYSTEVENRGRIKMHAPWGLLGTLPLAPPAFLTCL